jgi:preprotein translocase subunit SecA
VVLSVLDRKWREHLYEMDYLREGIGLRAMAQRDPLVEYQREGYDLFVAMMDGIKEESIGLLFNLEVQVQPTPTPEAAQPEPVVVAKGLLSPQRPQQLEYTAPAVDGDERVVHRTAAATPAPAQAAAARAGGAQMTGRGAGQAATASSAPPAARGRPGATKPTRGTEAQADDEAIDYGNVARNAPCPCGSGKKFKRCHGDPRHSPDRADRPDRSNRPDRHRPAHRRS